MAEQPTLEELFTNIADAIREKEGSVEDIDAVDFPARIRDIETSNTDVEDALITGNGLIEYVNNRIDRINAYAFSSPYLIEINAELTLQKIRCDNATRIELGAFAFCGNLTEAVFPNVIHIGQFAFNFCASLKYADFSTAWDIGEGAFENATKLVRADVYGRTWGPSAFAHCSSLATLVIRNIGDMVTSADENSNFVLHTPISNGTGFIYVPSSMIEKYKANGYWGQFANQFRALEDYTVDGTTTGELDESKINT